MNYIFCALYHEASCFIEKYKLISVNDPVTGIYTNGDVVCVVTGTGKLNAVYSVSRTFALYPPDSKSVVINAGICAGENVGETYIANVISDSDTKRSFYPDMIYSTGLNEMPLITSSDVVTSVEPGYIYDMEGYGIFMASAKSISPDRMFYIKTVSDMDGTGVTPDRIRTLMESGADVVDRILGSTVQTQEKEDDVSDIANLLYCSEYMRNELSQLYEFGITLGLDSREELRGIMESYGEIKSRKDGREVLNEFRRQLTSL